MVTKRWIDGIDCSQEDWDAIDAKLAAKGWMSLNRRTSRILVAERDGKIVGLFCLQLVPHIEPLLVDRSEWSTGLAEELADEMQNFLVKSKARGFVAICENPIAEKMCQAREMLKIHFPVYVSPVDTEV